MLETAASSDVLTDLILEVFRVNGRLVAAGDELVAPIGLTSARWQVLGAIELAPSPKSVAGLARSMGLTRQSVQRIVNELAIEGVVRLIDNPHHKRAKHVVLSAQGETLLAAASQRQAPWAKALAKGLDPSVLDQSLDLLRVLRQRLESLTDRGHEP